MKNRWLLIGFAVGFFPLVTVLTSTPDAKADSHEAKNLKLFKDTGKELENGMKEFSKGLGVKCNACHVKGDFGSDKVTAKEDARTFFKAVLDEPAQDKRDQALTALTTALKVKQAKKPEMVWTSLKKFQKK